MNDPNSPLPPPSEPVPADPAHLAAPAATEPADPAHLAAPAATEPADPAKEPAAAHAAIPRCEKCQRPISVANGSCYYCRELSPQEEAKLKVMLAEWSHNEEKMEDLINANENKVRLTKVFLIILTAGFLTAFFLRDSFFPKEDHAFLFLVAALAAGTNAFLLDAKIAFTQLWTLVCSLLSAMGMTGLCLVAMKDSQLKMLLLGMVIVVCGFLSAGIIGYMFHKNKQ